MSKDYCYQREIKLRKMKEERTREIISHIVGALFSGIMIFGLGWMFVNEYTNADQTYAIASENGNGIHYEYVTDRVCTITEITEETVTVEYKGNLYIFYADNTSYKTGEKIICTFNGANEIIDAK